MTTWYPIAFIVDKEAYYLELLRYVVLNPVWAKMVGRPEQYRWSSYGAVAGYVAPPEWLKEKNEALTLFFAPRVELYVEVCPSWSPPGSGRR